MKKALLGFSILCAAAVLFVAGDVLLSPFLNREEYRGEIRTLYGALSIGMDRAQVEASATGGRYPHLRCSGAAARWMAFTPFELGAKNWILVVDFDSASRASAIRIRTADSMNEHPDAAPADKQVPPMLGP